MPIRPGTRILIYGRKGRSPLSLRAGNTIAFGELLRRSPIVLADRLAPAARGSGAFDRINFGGMSAARRPSATRPAGLLAPRGPVGQVTDLYNETTVISLDALADRLCRKPL